MIPSRATSIRSYRILNKSLIALSLSPGALEWASKRREIIKLFPPDSDILETLEKEMAPAIFQISRQALTGDSDDVPVMPLGANNSNNENENTTTADSSCNNNNIGLKAIQHAIRETFRLSNENVLDHHPSFLKTILSEKQMADYNKLSSSATTATKLSSSSSKSLTALEKEQIRKTLITTIGMHRQKLIFDALRTINTNIWFYSDRFWWRCFPVGGGVVMDKSTRWAQTPAQLGDSITAAMKHHYTSIKEAEEEERDAMEQRKNSASYPIMGDTKRRRRFRNAAYWDVKKPFNGYDSTSSSSSQSNTMMKSDISSRAEEAAGATNPYAAAVYRYGNSPSAHERLARSALFRLSFSAAGIYSRVASTPSSLNDAQQQIHLHNAQMLNSNNSIKSSSASAASHHHLQDTPEDIQRQKLLMQFPKLREQFIQKDKKNSSSGSGSPSTNKSFVPSFDPPQSVVAELYLRSLKALSYHAFFAQLTTEITRYAPCEDWVYFDAFIEANVRDGLDEKIVELLRELPDPAKIESMSQLKAAAVKAHASILSLLLNPSSSAVSINNNSSSYSINSSKKHSESILDGDDEPNPIQKIEKMNQVQRRKEIMDLANRQLNPNDDDDNPEEDLEKLGKLLGDLSPEEESLFKSVSQKSVENVMKDLPAQVLVRMISHIVECCLQYCNENIDESASGEQSGTGDVMDKTKEQEEPMSMSNTTKQQQSALLVRSLLPVFETAPLLGEETTSTTNANDESSTANTTNKRISSQLPQLQNRLSLHGAVFLIAGVMARLGIPWRTMKGNAPQQAPGHAYFSSSVSVPDTFVHEDDPVMAASSAATATSDAANAYPRRRGYQRFTPDNLEEARQERLQAAKRRSVELGKMRRDEELATTEEDQQHEFNDEDDMTEEEFEEAVRALEQAREKERQQFQQRRSTPPPPTSSSNLGVGEQEGGDDVTSAAAANFDDFYDDEIIDHAAAPSAPPVASSSRRRLTPEPKSSLKKQSKANMNRDDLMHFVEQKRKAAMIAKKENAVRSSVDEEELAYLDKYRHNHFETVDIEGEQASPPNFIELQLNGIVLREGPTKKDFEDNATTGEGDASSKESGGVEGGTTTSQQKRAITNKDQAVSEEEALSARMLAEKRMIGSDGEYQDHQKVPSAPENNSDAKKPTNGSSTSSAEAAKKSPQLRSHHMLFPVFIELYRTSNESPIINGTVVAPRELADHVQSALILEYTNMGILRESRSAMKATRGGLSMMSNKKRSSSPSHARHQRAASNATGNDNSVVSPVPWSKGPRQDPILGLTSHICHSHLTKCEILAFDEFQGEKERNKHMTLLRDATNLWTSVLQLF